MKVRLQDGQVCFLQDSGERVVSADSVTTCSATWFVYPFEVATSYAPIVNKSVHPIWSGLYCKSVGIKKYGDGALITAQYEGADAWNFNSDNGENTIEVSVTMREEPIESHPDFEKWAGTPQKPNCGIFDSRKVTILKFPNVEYLYRVSYNANNPQELLISGQDKSGNIFSWICNPLAKRLQSICVNGKPAYKSAFFKDTLYYAERNDNAGFEERHVVATNTFKTSELCFSAYVQVETEKLTQPIIELLMNFTNSMANWAKSGFKIADAETLEKRKSLCLGCEYWDTTAYMGLGKCKKCGCSSAKLRLESEHCPISKW